MNDLFQLSAPWWHFVLRAVAIYLMVMLLVRISGKRAVGQFTPFDLVLLILIGNAVQNGLNGGDNSMTGAAVLAVCLIGLNYLAAWLSSRSATARKLIEGVPTVLAKDGHVFRDVLRRELVSKADFHEAMRQAGCLDVAQIRLATLETDGHITLLVEEARKHSPPPDPKTPG